MNMLIIPEYSWDRNTKTNSVELRPSWEATSRKVIQKFPNISCNPKVQYPVHMSPPLVPIIQSIQPHPISLKYILILSYHLRLGVVAILLVFPPHPYMHSSSLRAFYMPYPTHRPWLDYSNYIRWRVQVMKLVMHLSPADHSGREV
jgi:hypothetical protein